jgi:RNA polymerase sigma-70 factor (ECF subfamily)
MSDRDAAVDSTEWVAHALDEYQAHLIHYAAQLLGDVDDARDVVQEAFLELCRMDRSAVEDRVGPWLFTVCRNRSVDLLRKEGRMRPEEQASPLDAAALDPAPASVVEGADSYERVLRIIALLPPIQQEVLRLRFEAELTYREISEVTGKSESNVGYLLHVALKTVRQQLHDTAAAGV